MVSERKRFLQSSTKCKGRDASSVAQHTELTKKYFNKVAKFLRFSIQTKTGLLAGMKVDYFTGYAAVDALMESQWSTANDSSKGQPVLFHNRMDCADYMQTLIDKNMVHRSYKVYKPKLNPDEKRKYKLEVHESQLFFDSNEDLYVWVYEPATLKQYLIGSLLVIVVIACCLFPLWPAKFRKITLYGSIGSAGLLGVLLILALLKYTIFAIVWLFTKGNVHFWFLPNLSEDVGFFESFVPVYQIKYPKNKKKKKDSNKICQDQTSLEPIEEEDNGMNSVFTKTEHMDNTSDDSSSELKHSSEDSSSELKHSSEEFEILSASELEPNPKL